MPDSALSPSEAFDLTSYLVGHGAEPGLAQVGQHGLGHIGHVIFAEQGRGQFDPGTMEEKGSHLPDPFGEFPQ